MKKSFALFIAVTTLWSCQNQAQQTKSNPIEIPMKKETIYQFNVQDLSGNAFDFTTLKGKKIMIVNTASECGLTPQYEQLQAVYEKYKEQNFVIVGFPANNFGSQEPGSNAQIATFCQKNYGVTFPMMAKISVEGSDQHPLYQFLTQKAKNGLEDSEVQWNFQKYLINESGELEKVVAPRTLPTDAEIINWIEGK
ncbi:glutathione peroxidase [Flavobacterium sp.]|jgi:glutathione peroxidase|uniref:glutathione peroxidase n=1 Tax=Flavobacterium sp. TaxID=239 RepID=UPI0037C08FBE